MAQAKKNKTGKRLDKDRLKLRTGESQRPNGTYDLFADSDDYFVVYDVESDTLKEIDLNGIENQARNEIVKDDKVYISNGEGVGQLSITEDGQCQFIELYSLSEEVDIDYINIYGDWLYCEDDDVCYRMKAGEAAEPLIAES